MLLFAELSCRICVLLSPRVFLHLDGFGRMFRHLFGSGMVHLQLKGEQVSVDFTIDLLMQDYGTVPPDTNINLRHPAEAWSMCRYIWGCSGYLRTKFHLHLPTFLHSIYAAETLNR